MGFEHTQGTCTGRGFADVDADGFLSNLWDFVDGHADWSIILDRSTYPTQKSCTGSSSYVVSCTGHGLKTGEVVQLKDTGSGVPSGSSADTDYYAIVVDADNFKLANSPGNVISDTELTLGDTAIGFGVIRMEPYILISPSGTPTDSNDLKSMVKIGYHTGESGYVRLQFVGAYDPTNEEILYVYDGWLLTSLDSAAFIFDFRANDNGLFYIQTFVSSTWYGAGVDEFAPLSNYLESPTTISGTLQAAVSNGSDVVCTLASSTEANLFTKNEWYYVYDFRYDSSYPRLMVAYGKCSGVGVADGLNADQIKFATLNNDFKDGAKISPYPLCTYTFQFNATAVTSTPQNFSDTGWKGKLPFYSRSDGTTGYYCIHDQAGDIQGDYWVSRDYNAIITAAPDDKGNYTCQRPLVCEYRRPNDTSGTTNKTSMNRIYGESKNIYLVDDDGLSEMTSGRTIDGKEHIAIGDEYSIFTGGATGLECLCLNEA